MMLLVQFKRGFLICLLMLFSIFLEAQSNHFVYLQTENNAPFYLKMNDKIINSSPTGYIILPNLADGNYTIAIGIPKSDVTESYFNITVGQKNEGYLLKNTKEGSLVLMNMQTQQLFNPNVEKPVQTSVSAPPTNDLFADMLANEVKDSSILSSTSIKPTTTVSENTTPVNASTTTSLNSFEENTIQKILSSNGKDGLEMVYIVASGNNQDTVRAFIPANKNSQFVTVNNDAEKSITPKELEQNKEPEQINQQITPENSTVIVTPDTTESKTILSSVKIEDKPIEVIVLPQIVTSSSVNSDCKSFATDKDFLLIRKKMAAETTDDAMIDAAKKIMRNTCFSTGQIKNLSYLFLTDEGKYRFFDAAYQFTSDSNLYYVLESQLKDSYYINRFKAMVQK